MSSPREALREKVAEELWHADSVRAVGTRRTVPWSESGARDQWLSLADAAIAVAMEEAARVALKPFAEYGRKQFHNLSEGTPVSFVVEPHVVWLEAAVTVGQFEAARAALEEK